MLYSLVLQCICRCSDEVGENGEEEESGDYLASCMQMTLICLESQSKT